jgi:endonuclease/exonuclease/phosphatase family metal-dependent hydrolase
MTEGRLRIVSYNIAKGVRGMGPVQRLEIHGVAKALRGLAPDVVALQEVRQTDDAHARRFSHPETGWPKEGQTQALARDDFEFAYRTNARTRGGEHGNAVLARCPIGDVRHHDVSDHRFEQRGLLAVTLKWPGGPDIQLVNVHLGLIHASRVRQVAALRHFLERELDPQRPVVVAGDFNDWNEALDDELRLAGLHRARPPQGPHRLRTFPSFAPVFSLDRLYLRDLHCVSMKVPRGPGWSRLSDHLPLVAELAWTAPEDTP